MFVIASEQTRELDRLQKILGQTWPALPSICDQSGNRFGPTDRVLRPFFTQKKTQHQKLENLYFSMI